MKLPEAEVIRKIVGEWVRKAYLTCRQVEFPKTHSIRVEHPLHRSVACNGESL